MHILIIHSWFDNIETKTILRRTSFMYQRWKRQKYYTIDNTVLSPSIAATSLVKYTNVRAGADPGHFAINTFVIVINRDDLVVKSWPPLRESLNEMVDVTELRAADSRLQLAPDCVGHRVEIRAVWKPLQRWYEILSFTTHHISIVSRARWAVDADVRVNSMECMPMFLETVNFWRPFMKCQYDNDGSTDFHYSSSAVAVWPREALRLTCSVIRNLMHRIAFWRHPMGTSGAI